LQTNLRPQFLRLTRPKSSLDRSSRISCSCSNPPLTNLALGSNYYSPKTPLTQTSFCRLLNPPKLNSHDVNCNNIRRRCARVKLRTRNGNFDRLLKNSEPNRLTFAIFGSNYFVPESLAKFQFNNNSRNNFPRSFKVATKSCG
jgi:hypothetical protein